MRSLAEITSLTLAILLITSCAPALPHPESAPGTRSPALPPIPLREGPLEIRVVYPPADAAIAARDSNFIHGSVGNGRASLRINGHRVTVHPNGAFLGWLPVPPPEDPRYVLVATLGSDSAVLEHPVRVPRPRPVLSDTGALMVDTASLSPADYTLRPAQEPVRLSIRAPANASVWLETGEGQRLGLSSGAASAGVHQARTLPQVLGTRDYHPDSTLWVRHVPAGLLRNATLVVARLQDTVRLPVLTVDAYDDPDGLGAPWGIIGADITTQSDTDRVVPARPLANGTYKWFLMPGTLVRMTGASGDFARVRLDDALEAWVNGQDIRVPPEGLPPPRHVAPNLRVVPHAEWVDVVFPGLVRPPHLVEEEGNTIVLTLYGATANTDIIRFARNDSLVRHITWEQLSRDRARFTLHLRERPYGYLVIQDGSNFVLRVRRTPRINANRPLRGLTIVVDPGHPPAGATGPTGLYEAIPLLEVGLRLRRILMQRGANVVMTRVTNDTLELALRPAIARRANAHALVSLHFDALPDGVNPFTAHGTASYWFHPHSEPMARHIQRGMIEHMGLRNLGVLYDNLALVRPTWMPAVLCEGAFIMIPEHEAAMRTAAFQEAYARGVADGLESYFRSLARGR